MRPQDLDYSRLFDAEPLKPTVKANAAQAQGMTDAERLQEVRALRADLEKIKRAALDAVRVSMDDLRRTLLAANPAQPRVNSGRVMAVGTAMRAR